MKIDDAFRMHSAGGNGASEALFDYSNGRLSATADGHGVIGAEETNEIVQKTHELTLIGSGSMASKSGQVPPAAAAAADGVSKNVSPAKNRRDDMSQEDLVGILVAKRIRCAGQDHVRMIRQQELVINELEKRVDEQNAAAEAAESKAERAQFYDAWDQAEELQSAQFYAAWDQAEELQRAQFYDAWDQAEELQSAHSDAAWDQADDHSPLAWSAHSDAAWQDTPTTPGAGELSSPLPTRGPSTGRSESESDFEPGLTMAI